MTFNGESVFEATDTVLHPTGSGRNRVESCPGDIFPGDTLLKLVNELDIAGADLSRSISKFERFLEDFPEWSQDGDEREMLRVMRERQMEQRKDFVNGILSPMLKRQYGIYRIFKDKTEERS